MAFLAFIVILCISCAFAATAHLIYAWWSGRQRWDRPKPTPLLKRRRRY